MRWVHGDKAAKPYAKGEGASHMVVGLVSADYRWLWSPDGEEEAWVLFKAGKICEGYFTAENILNQAAKAIDILEKHSLDEDHVLVYNNATPETSGWCFVGTLCAIEYIKTGWQLARGY